MSENIVRRLLVDLSAPMARQWNGGDAFRTAFFNALSMSFPIGEQFFIDSLREGIKLAPPAERQRLDAELRGFIGQEATHRHLHGLFNAHLQRQGHVNRWEQRVAARLKWLEGSDPRHAVAITAATEHLTTILAAHLLGHPDALRGAEPRLQALWLWHAAEETEHCSTALEVYAAIGGSLRWRRRWFRRVSVFFVTDLARQTLRNLQHDRQLWRLATWRSAAVFLFGREGVVRRTFGPWRAYFDADHDPACHDQALAERWLAEHARLYRVVGADGPMA